ncbi:hypothetical protein AT268_32090 [Bacillus cereus]|uniref:Uncharacterized protein n=1 Tax=Bacillus cereus TaxID=1396 RepID=A0A9X0MJV3_BACCE|nr:hypothetical protein [Bacillus cereus]KXY51142.1 hypothetical protein AT268_32090 [Bacillus cereus]
MTNIAYNQVKEDESKILQVKMYEEVKEGFSIFSDNRVEIIGEQTMSIDGKILEQYLYNIDGYTPDNGKPFVSLKSNIILL